MSPLHDAILQFLHFYNFYSVQILPAILAKDEADFRAHIMHRELRKAAPMWHVDVLDGSMFHTNCWADAKVVGQWDDLPEIELHVMTHNPLATIEEWHEHVSTLRRAIIHAEVARPLGAIIERATHLGLETGLAVNPETTLERIHHHLTDLDAVQIMGVHPGASGREFLGEPILSKIRRTRALFPNICCSVDGGVTLQNARHMVEAGADRLVANSCLWQSPNPEEVYRDLKSRGVRDPGTQGWWD